MSRKNNDYSKKLKLKIVKEYFETNISQNKLAIKYEIKSKTQVAVWIKKYKEKENQYLKMQVDYLKKLTDWERW